MPIHPGVQAPQFGPGSIRKNSLVDKVLMSRQAYTVEADGMEVGYLTPRLI